jgi:hypothetical protein
MGVRELADELLQPGHRPDLRRVEIGAAFGDRRQGVGDHSGSVALQPAQRGASFGEDRGRQRDRDHPEGPPIAMASERHQGIEFVLDLLVGPARVETLHSNDARGHGLSS